MQGKSRVKNSPGEGDGKRESPGNLSRHSRAFLTPLRFHNLEDRGETWTVFWEKKKRLCWVSDKSPPEGRGQMRPGDRHETKLLTELSGKAFLGTVQRSLDIE
ncbi:hypothetical protein SKAU_G00318600 [Synaphobranchus kaupii]|uniref:Uncharacterized protein n=1 Tax=Synaphobranchus kaupii TaxID=118154 RepID=A0A9Q1IL13_SYNKA|nr:hypothetical protein SKAU_G00318600 [Synaphobranchus kaupii]